VNIAKTLSALSLAFALQAGALVAATVIIAPSDAAAATRSKAKPQKKSQKKAPARGKIKTRANFPGEQPPLMDKQPPKEDPWWKGIPKNPQPPPPGRAPDCESHPDLCRNTASKRH
jgi:hypothetical protein